ncbi:pantetheine-phosphate adenylyltransferase [Reichenbachiella agarivorans]|uniref:Phosphopantetheine adenylyltransferase n=1 Tax=Reichenbachiella agarivorans TaxID=2979464 RepID=A0ABY6CMK4_9BACT|nr:pantetheine-phosphate adenylyltransferase [Reichenbachiella agarivorans]UXP31300.1 pantetheine-phosphate adenylyltransferase [Reichenbachiella agarivorans]
MSAKKIALFPGSFDPFTKGHLDIVLRADGMFDEIIIAIGHNSQKKRYFDIEYMIEKIEGIFADNDKISVITYNELTAVLAKKVSANYLLRGLRNTTDFEYENSISQVNRYLNTELETVFLITSPEFAHISSTIIREVHKYDGDISAFVPYAI